MKPKRKSSGDMLISPRAGRHLSGNLVLMSSKAFFLLDSHHPMAAQSTGLSLTIYKQFSPILHQSRKTWDVKSTDLQVRTQYSKDFQQNVMK